MMEETRLNGEGEDTMTASRACSQSRENGVIYHDDPPCAATVNSSSPEILQGEGELDDKMARRTSILQESAQNPAAYFVPSSSPLLSSPPTIVFGLSDPLHPTEDFGPASATKPSVYPEQVFIKPATFKPAPTIPTLDSPFHSQELRNESTTPFLSSPPMSGRHRERTESPSHTTLIAVGIAVPNAESGTAETRLIISQSATPTSSPQSMLNQTQNLLTLSTTTPSLTNEDIQLCSVSSLQKIETSCLIAQSARPSPLMRSGYEQTSSLETPSTASLPAVTTVSSPPAKSNLDVGEIHSSPISRKRSSPAEDFTPPPSTKRMALSAQRKQHQKLSTPFRSPFMSKTNSAAATSSSPSRSNTSKPASFKGKGKEDVPSTPLLKANKLYTPSRSAPFTSSASPTLKSTNSKTLFKSSTKSSTKASAPFKSPFRSTLNATAAPSSSSASTPLRSSFSGSTSAIGLTPSRTIHALEGKLAQLRRALKIKREGEGEKLQGLVKKWRDAGREAAWELWGMVREEGGDTGAAGGGSGSSWGAEESKTSGSRHGGGGFDSGWGWANEKSDWGGDSWGWNDPQHKKGISHNDVHRDVDEDEDDFVPESPSKLEDALYKSLRRQPAVPRTSMLPPTPRGSYYAHRVSEGEACESYVDEATDQAAELEDGERGEKAAVGQRTMGTLLTQLGIMHQTLGWDEEEGDFVDK